MGVAYAAVWMITVSCLLYLPAIFMTLISYDLFNTISCLNFVGDLFISVSICIGACFVEESTDSLPIFNLRFCPLLSFRVSNDDENIIIKFDFWSVESLKEEGDFWERSVLFRELLAAPWLILLYFVAINFPVMRENGDCFMVILYQFQLFLWLKYWKLLGDLLPASWQPKPKDHQLQSMQQI